MADEIVDSAKLRDGTEVVRYADGAVELRLPDGGPWVIEEAWLTGQTEHSVLLARKAEAAEEAPRSGRVIVWR